MGSVNKCNISLLDSYYQQFSNEKDKFNSTAYKTFSSSYLTRCNDYNIIKMKNNLEKVYSIINKGYKNIDSWWNSYNDDMKGVENALSNDSKTSSIKEGLLRNFINGQLPSLKNFDVTFSDLVSNKPLSTLPNSVFINNTVVSSVGVNDIFASVYKEFDDGKTLLKKGNKEATKIKTSKFNEAGLSNDSFLEATGAFVLGRAESLYNTINQGFSDASDWWKNEAVPWINNAHQVVNDVLDSAGAFVSSAGDKIANGVNDFGKFWSDVKCAFGEIALGIMEGDFERVAATIANMGISFVEGLLQFGEAIIDFAAIAHTVSATLFTGIFDIGQGIYGLVTGNEWSSATKALWDQTMGFVSEKHVTSWFDYFYENNWIGQFIKQNSYSFDTFRSLSSGVGYTAGVVILTIATFGAGGAAVAGGAATTSGAVAATSATQMSVVAGIAGVGRGTENAWANGAGAVEGLVAGGLTGLWEGFQFYVGGKISNFQMLKGASTVGSRFLNGMGRVVLDGLDGGAEGFVQPFINMIYADGYYDENGNYIEFTANDNILERYYQLFDDNGGFGAIFTNAAVGSASSAIGEAFDLRKYFNQEKSSVTNNVDVVENVDVAENVDNLNSSGLRQSNINIEEQIAAANYYTGKGNFYTIKVNSLDDIPKDMWSKIDDPSNVYISVGDKVMTVADAKGETILSQYKKTSVDISSIEEQIAAANYYTGKGNFYTIKVNSLDDIPKDIWSKIDDPSNVYIKIGDKLFDFDTARKLHNENSVKIESDSIRLKNRVEAATFFNDPIQYLIAIIDDIYKRNINNPGIKSELLACADIIKNTPVRELENTDVKKILSKYLTEEEKTVFSNLEQARKLDAQYTEVEKDIIQSYTKYSGPAIAAYLRNAVTVFKNTKESTKFDGTNKKIIQDYVTRSNIAIGKGDTLKPFSNINNFIEALDKIIDKSSPLKENLIVYRGVDSLFLDGEKLCTFDIGQRFNDSAFTSASVLPTGISSVGAIQLEIELPKGTNVAYLEKYTGIKLYNQQEVLIGRNSTFEIVDYPIFDPKTGQTKLKVKLVKSSSSFVEKLNLKLIDRPNMYLSYYNNIRGANTSNNIDLKDVIDTLKTNGLLDRYENEVKDISRRGLYRYNIPEHNVDHVERVMLYSMYMGQKLNLSPTEMNILIEAAKYHDSGRVDLKTDTQHAVLSADKAMLDLYGKYSYEDLNSICAAIEYHESADQQQILNKIFEKYRITPEKQGSIYLISNILKDADALDRTRFPGNLDEKRLRNDIAYSMIKPSYQVQEIRAQTELNRMINNNELSSSNINKIKYLQSKGVSDYLLFFWIKYNKLNDYMNRMLEGYYE